MDRISKKIFILLVAVLSFISFTVGVKATNGDNEGQDNHGTSSGTMYSTVSNTTPVVKVTIYRGTTYKASKYFQIASGTIPSGRKCEFSNSYYRPSITKLSDNYAKFSCSTSNSTLSPTYIGGYGGAWGFDLIEGSKVQEYLEKNNYAIVNSMIGNMNFTLEVGDYVVIEPVLFVSARLTDQNDNITHYGTVISLMERNIGFQNIDKPNNAPLPTSGSEQTAFVYYYSRFLDAFRAKSGLGDNYCFASTYPTNSPSTTWGHTITNCGYFGYYKTSGGWDPDHPKNGNLKLLKVNTSGTTISGSTVSVKVCKAGSNSCISKTFTGSTTISNLDVGTYYVYETKAPSGYYIPNNNYYVGSVNVQSGSPVPFKITNKNECEYNFDELADKSMIGRIQFYLKYSKYKNYKNILNLNKTTGKDACTPIETKTNYESGCLGIKTNFDTSFKETNLSSYDSYQTYENNTYSFCKTIFSFNSNVGNNGSIKSSYSYNNGKIDFGLFKSGKMVLSRNAENKKIAEGILNIVCYVYGPKSTQYVNDKSYKENDYNSKVKSVMLYKSSDKTKTNYLTSENFKSVVTNTNIASSQCIKHDVTLTYDYSLSPIYARYGSGEVVSKTSSLNKREIGNGIISSFKEIGKVKLKFDVKIGDETMSNENCTYSVKQELVKCIDGTCDDPGDPWELNLEFRQISKSNPFPGKSGSGRKVGANWCDGNNCKVENNTIVKGTITDKNDSYNSTGAGPKYVINLNTKTIEQIKNKNKGQAYDDFGENCNTSSGTCAIDFINWMKTQGILKEG